jgi:hypothetical protein
VNSVAQTGPARSGRTQAASARSGRTQAASARPGRTQASSARPGSPRPGPALARKDRPRRLPPAALALLDSAKHQLAAAADESSAGSRYVAAHLAALRAAAAVVAARAEPGAPARRRKPPSVWELLPKVEPELREWAAFFAAGAGKRAAAEAGLARAVSFREADDLLRDAETFLSLAEETLGIIAQPLLPLASTG